jgi:hypothetical protein
MKCPIYEGVQRHALNPEDDAKGLKVVIEADDSPAAYQRKQATQEVVC